jgi:hypothetical protein
MPDERSNSEEVGKELNVDFWFYQSHEYHRGDLVNVDPDNAHHRQLMDEGVLVEPGLAAQLAQEQADAEDTAAALAAEAQEFADQEAHRKTDAAQARLTGDLGRSDESGESDAADDAEPKHSSGVERSYIVRNNPKGATRRLR